MFRLDPSKRDGLYPTCKPCLIGWTTVVKVTQWSGCQNCGRVFKPRHNKGVYVRHCSRACFAQSFSGSNGTNWQGDDVGYSAAHTRVRRLRGSATFYQCTDCGAQAAQWSVDRETEGLRQQDGMPYSPDPNAYVPRCVSCHKLYDLAAVA